MQRVERILLDAMKADIEMVREKLIQKSVKDYESELRRKLLSRAIDIGAFFDVQTIGQKIEIRVRVQKEELK